MKQAKLFLQLLTERQPAGHGQYHTLAFEDGELVVTMRLNDMTISIALDDDDLGKEVGVLVDEVIETSGVETQ